MAQLLPMRPDPTMPTFPLDIFFLNNFSDAYFYMTIIDWPNFFFTKFGILDFYILIGDPPPKKRPFEIVLSFIYSWTFFCCKIVYVQFIIICWQCILGEGLDATELTRYFFDRFAGIMEERELHEHSNKKSIWIHTKD